MVAWPNQNRGFLFTVPTDMRRGTRQSSEKKIEVYQGTAVRSSSSIATAIARKCCTTRTEVSGSTVDCSKLARLRYSSHTTFWIPNQFEPIASKIAKTDKFANENNANTAMPIELHRPNHLCPAKQSRWETLARVDANSTWDSDLPRATRSTLFMAIAT